VTFLTDSSNFNVKEIAICEITTDTSPKTKRLQVWALFKRDLKKRLMRTALGDTLRGLAERRMM
jgi:hypothetical protein